MIQAYFKGKSAIDFDMNEDFKTSSSIGLLQYLPDEIFWKILQDSCDGFPSTNFGTIKSFNFWAHTDATKTSNTQFVEPDVWIETEKYDIIIEAKVSDDSGQYATQWENEILSIKNEQRNNNYEKQIILIALGGNATMHNEKAFNYPVYKASWFNLLNAISKEQKEQSDHGYLCRILNDIIELFARQGVMNLKWMNTLPVIPIQENDLNFWSIFESKVSIGFATLSQININEKILQKWNPNY